MTAITCVLVGWSGGQLEKSELVKWCAGRDNFDSGWFATVS